MAKQQLVGGSFAPPVDDEKLSAYEQLANSCDDQMCSGYMLDLVKMLRLFRETPDSQQKGTKHPTGLAYVVPLEESEVKRIWDVVPWSEECDVIGRAFDRLTGDTRNAAYHLLWFARELTVDREPMTTDKL